MFVVWTRVYIDDSFLWLFICVSSLIVFDFILHVLGSRVTEIVSRIFKVFSLFLLGQ